MVMDDAIIQTVTTDESPAEQKTPMQEIDNAYKACGFGKFHLRLIFVSFFGTVAGVLVTHTTSYLLPVAECDLDMDLLEKGLLNSAPFCGMLVTSVIGGFLADTFGRKLFLMLGFGGVFVFSMIAGSSQNFEVLLTAKFFEGVSFATAISSHVTFISEFCYKSIRDKIMIYQSSFVAIAQIVSPLMAWGILVQDWKFTLFNGYIVLNTWNFYLYIMSSWSFLACVLYTTLPESPKYLVTQQKYEEARIILMKMYKENTGKEPESYPYKDIWKNIDKKDDQSESKAKSTSSQLLAGLHNVKQIFVKPQLFSMIILSCTMFLILAIYNIVRLWFPQLSTIVEHYKDGGQDLCVLLDSYTSNLKTRSVSMNSTTDTCVPNKSGAETYINSIIIGIVCLFPYFITGAVVNRVGKKVCLTVCSLISVAATLGLRWSSSKVSVVALFAVDTAIAQLMKGLNQAATVELFNTNVRSLALALVLTSGRLGTLTGNIGFPVLLDMGCVVPFFSMAGMMMCVTVLTLFMPTKK